MARANPRPNGCRCNMRPPIDDIVGLATQGAISEDQAIMSQAIHRVIKIHDRPRDQCLRLLDWFNESGTQRFDLHVRRYQKGISGTSETWITCHEDICAKQLIDFWPWLRRENANGADVYFRPHSRASHSIIFLDDVDLVKAHNFAKAYSSVVIQTSCNNAHVWVKTKTPLSLEQRYETQSALAKQGICDSGSTSGDHLGRLCGMFSQKRQCWVNLVLFSTPRAYDAPRQDSTSGQQGGGGACFKSSKQAFPKRSRVWLGHWDAEIGDRQG